MNLRVPLARVRGLGSAKDGTSHWWGQRLSALALIPLTVWFVVSLVAMTGATHGEFLVWASSPVVAGLLVLLILATFWHGALGVQVVIEDYVHDEALKFTALIVLKGVAIVLATCGVLAVLTLLFRG